MVEVVIKTLGAHLAEDIRNYGRMHADIAIRVLDGNDTGIYDALNVCAASAAGEFVLYLGCGDTLADDFVASDFAAIASPPEIPQVLYGPVLMADSAGNVSSLFSNRVFFGMRKKLPWRNPCHSQGICYRRTWLVTRPFRTDIGPLADMVHTYHYKVDTLAVWINRPISIFREGGISSSRDAKHYRAWLRGVHANCENFAFPAAWRLISTLICRVGIALGK
ncbi:hypothetical protein BH11PSE8_BH11PSE8_17720 [soil metagenome]